MFRLENIDNIVIINKKGETIHRFAKNYFEAMRCNDTCITRALDPHITSLPLQPIKIRKWRIIDCFIWKKDLYILDSFINFQEVASNILYGSTRMSAIKIFSWEMNDMQYLIRDSYAYRVADLSFEQLVTNTINEMATLDITIGRRTLSKIMQHYTLTIK